MKRSISQRQADFRPGRSTAEQMMALTSLIEAGFERKMNTDAVFVEFSAAYDTVWKDGLLYKIAHLVRDRKILKLLPFMTGKRKYSVLLGDQRSQSLELINGVLQGSENCTNAFQYLY